MTYLFLRHLHIGCVMVSGAGFFLRGVWMLRASPWLQQPLVRILPHVVDTLLLASAIALAIVSAQYPFVNDWLTAKLVGLLLYIGCGTMALKRARTRRRRAGFFVAALAAFAYVVSVAITRQPLGFLTWLG